MTECWVWLVRVTQGVVGPACPVGAAANAIADGASGADRRPGGALARAVGGPCLAQPVEQVVAEALQLGRRAVADILLPGDVGCLVVGVRGVVERGSRHSRVGDLAVFQRLGERIAGSRSGSRPPTTESHRVGGLADIGERRIAIEDRVRRWAARPRRCWRRLAGSLGTLAEILALTGQHDRALAATSEAVGIFQDVNLRAGSRAPSDVAEVLFPHDQLLCSLSRHRDAARLLAQAWHRAARHGQEPGCDKAVLQAAYRADLPGFRDTWHRDRGQLSRLAHRPRQRPDVTARVNAPRR